MTMPLMQFYSFINFFGCSPCILPRVSGHSHSAQESTEMRSLHQRVRETKKFLSLSSSRLFLKGWGSWRAWRGPRFTARQPVGTAAPHSLAYCGISHGSCTSAPPGLPGHQGCNAHDPQSLDESSLNCMQGPGRSHCH